MSIPNLALTGAVLYSGIKLLRRRFQPTDTVQPIMATAPVVEAPTPAIPFLPPKALQILVANDGLRKVAIVTLTGATAVMHLGLGLQLPSALFVWNGVGYAVLLAGHYAVPQLAAQRGETRDLLAAYTGTTIVTYFVQRGVAGLLDPTGMTNKVIELGLLGLLWFEKEKEEPSHE